MCGKYVVVIVSNGTESGSPPHVREIHISSFSLASSIRITPACAGNTPAKVDFDGYQEDHPRMCGKYPHPFRQVEPFQGSPPHVREIRISTDADKQSDRITPACAGNTVKPSFHALLHEDHPRMCGKYLLLTGNGYARIGSPPHVREIH